MRLLTLYLLTLYLVAQPQTTCPQPPCQCPHSFVNHFGAETNKKNIQTVNHRHRFQESGNTSSSAGPVRFENYSHFGEEPQPPSSPPPESVEESSRAMGVGVSEAVLDLLKEGVGSGVFYPECESLGTGLDCSWYVVSVLVHHSSENDAFPYCMRNFNREFKNNI